MTNAVLWVGLVGPGEAGADVDQKDFGILQSCLSPSGVLPVGSSHGVACTECRFDDDEDVDEGDIAIFLDCLSGEGIAADPSCDQSS
jgi:hypothetical protein